MSQPITLTDASFNEFIAKSDKPVIVDFWAEWCGPCKVIGPILEELAQEMDGKISIAKVDVDENPEIATQYGIRSLPTLMKFEGGQKTDETIGAQSKSQLQGWITGA